MALPPLEPPEDRPTDEKLDRDRFYSEPAADADDDGEYELEEVDEELIAHAKERARKELERAEKAIDVDEIYRELDHRDDLGDALQEVRARFSLRSLLWVMTGVALLMGLAGSGFFSSGALFAVLIGVSVLALGAAHAWLNHREKTRRAELLEKRAEQLRAARRQSGDPVDEEEIIEVSEPPPAGGVFGSVVDGLKLKQPLGMGELAVAIGAGSVLVGLLSLAGSPARAAAALGAIAVLGFAIQAAEVDVPRPLLLAWWLALLGYCLMTLILGLLGAVGWVLGVG